MINHELVTVENVARTIRFPVGRVRWFSHHLSDDFQQRIVIDDRGQPVSRKSRSALRASLETLTVVTFISEDEDGI